MSSPLRTERYRCVSCGARFSETTAPDVSGPPCPACGSWQLRARRDPGEPAVSLHGPPAPGAPAGSAPVGAEGDQAGAGRERSDLVGS